MLRVVFRWKETKQPVQLVLQEYERPVQHLDYSEQPAEEKELIQQLLNRTMIVSPESSCFQVVLAKLAPDVMQCVFTITMPFSTDGVSAL